MAVYQWGMVAGALVLSAIVLGGIIWSASVGWLSDRVSKSEYSFFLEFTFITAILILAIEYTTFFEAHCDLSTNHDWLDLGIEPFFECSGKCYSKGASPGSDYFIEKMPTKELREAWTKICADCAYWYNGVKWIVAVMVVVSSVSSALAILIRGEVLRGSKGAMCAIAGTLLVMYLLLMIYLVMWAAGGDLWCRVYFTEVIIYFLGLLYLVIFGLTVGRYIEHKKLDVDLNMIGADDSAEQ
jgi:hypothetical protein